MCIYPYIHICMDWRSDMWYDRRLEARMRASTYEYKYKYNIIFMIHLWYGYATERQTDTNKLTIKQTHIRTYINIFTHTYKHILCNNIAMIFLNNVKICVKWDMIPKNVCARIPKIMEHIFRIHPVRPRGNKSQLIWKIKIYDDNGIYQFLDMNIYKTNIINMCIWLWIRSHIFILYPINLPIHSVAGAIIATLLSK